MFFMLNQYSHPWAKSQLVMVYTLTTIFMCCWIEFASMLLTFAFIFIGDIGLSFSFLVMFLPGFGIRIILDSLLLERLIHGTKDITLLVFSPTSMMAPSQLLLWVPPSSQPLKV